MTVERERCGNRFRFPTMTELFEAFYSTKDEGMGVGLSVSRSIIENHQGRLWAVLNADAGLLFSFLFRVDPAPDRRSTPHRYAQYLGVRVVTREAAHHVCMATRADWPGKTEAAANRPLVAIIDDDESVRESLPDLLRGLGFAAKPFDSAEAFLSFRRHVAGAVPAAGRLHAGHVGSAAAAGARFAGEFTRQSSSSRPGMMRPPAKG